MNKEEMGLFNDLWHIGTDMMSWDYKEPADKLKEKIIKTFEENKQLQQENHQLKEDIKELEFIIGLRQKRNLIKKFDKEYDAEDKKKNPNRDYAGIIPDAEEVYKRYYQLKEELECKKGMNIAVQNQKLIEENQQLKDNWNELKKWLGETIKYDENWYKPECKEYMGQKQYPDDTIDGFNYVLDKMQELEGKSE